MCFIDVCLFAGSVVSSDDVLRNILTDNLHTLTTLGRVKEVKVEEPNSHSHSLHSTSAVSTISSSTTVYLHLQACITLTTVLGYVGESEGRWRKKMLPWISSVCFEMQY